MADKRISQLVDRGTVANSDVVPIVVSGASTTNKATISSIQTFMQGNLDLGVTSVGLSMPSAFTVTGSPVTSSGNISVVGAGTVSQYIRGDGSLADFPQGGGGGGASVNYYLNGSVSQGTIGGIAYYEMNKVPILGTGTDFVAIADGYLASFITDAGDPSLLQIPGGNWNFETYFSASSGGGTPTFYVELYKVDSGGTATLIASNSGTPELIAFGTTINPYFSTLAVPTTTLALTDRLALRYYVARSGRTITMHTENSHLCQIITTFTTGLTALNGLTAQVQNFATGTSGTDFAISSSSSTHTFNLPTASATNRGVLSSADWTTFNNKTSNLGTVTSVGLSSATSGVTIGSTPITTSGTITLAIATASGSQNGLLSSTDWTTFNGKQNALTNPVTGTGVNERVALWNGTNSINSDSDFTYNSSTNLLTIGGGITLTGAQTIQTSTGNLTLATAAGNGNIVLNAHGDGNVTTNDSIFIGSTSGINYGGLSNKLSVATTSYNLFDISRFSNDNDGARLYLGKSRGSTIGSSVIVQNGDLLGTIQFEGDCGEGMVPAASISAEVDGVPGLTSDMPGRLIFRTCSDNTIFAAERMRITSAGKVGIGTDNPPSKFSVQFDKSAAFAGAAVYDSQVYNASDHGGTLGFGGTFNSSGGYTEWSAIGGMKSNTTDGNVSGDINFYTRLNSSAMTERMRITSSGIVQVMSGNELRAYRSDNTRYGSFFTDNLAVQLTSSNDPIRISSADRTEFYTAGTERMRITSGGYLKAANNGGYNNATGTFHELTQNLNGASSAILTHGGTSDPYGLEVNFTGHDPNNATNYMFGAYKTSGGFVWIYRIFSNGTVSARSDARWKKNIETTRNGYIDDLCKLRVVKYNWYNHEDDAPKELGLIAQEVEEVFPNLIQIDPVIAKREVEQEDGTIIEEEFEDGVSRSIKTSVLPFMLLKAIQEQQAQIEELKTEINSLKNQIK